MTGLLIAGAIFTSGGLLGGVAAADDGLKESITLSPVDKHYKFDAGSVIHDQLTVVNDGQLDYDFSAYAKPYSVTGENYDPDFSTTHTNTDIQDWVKFAQNTYHLKAGQSIKVDYTVTVPQNATPGGHYAVLFVETEPTAGASAGGTSVIRKKRVGALVYATVNGSFQNGGKLTSMRTPVFQFVPPIKSDLTIQNSGTTDFQATTSLTVSDIFGNVKYSQQKPYQLLPQTIRAIHLTWDKAPSYGLYKVVTSASFLDENKTTTTYVIMAPVWLYLFLVLILIAVVVYFVQKRR